jgi:hypothetical protein
MIRPTEVITLASCAAAAYGLKVVWAKYFQGNLLGFFGLCTLVVIACVLIRYAATYRRGS